MIDGTFAFVRGVGPARERQLYRAGIRSWAEFPAVLPLSPPKGQDERRVVLSAALDDRIRAAIVEMDRLLASRRWEELAARLPAREHWRFLPHLLGELTYLDIETTAGGTVTVVGLYDEALGPRLYVRGHNLGDFLGERPVALVTFNGASFDLPILRRTFPGWRPPVHVDLRQVLRHAGERGGLKAIEQRLGIGRPEHLQGMDGLDAIALWAAFGRSGDVGALRLLLEYNLYDVVQLRSLVEIACERLSRRSGRPWTPGRRFARGDVLLDVSRAVDAVVASARRIEPEQFHAEERRSFRG